MVYLYFIPPPTCSSDVFFIGPSDGKAIDNSGIFVEIPTLGVRGDDGVTGVWGIDGDMGVEGIGGDTGVEGIGGDTGVEGVNGDDTEVEGIGGDTGVEGVLGIKGIWPICLGGSCLWIGIDFIPTVEAVYGLPYGLPYGLCEVGDGYCFIGVLGEVEMLEGLLPLKSIGIIFCVIFKSIFFVAFSIFSPEYSFL
jgi:hypothetical protein